MFDGIAKLTVQVEPEDLDFIYRMENDPAHWAMTDFTVPYSRYALRRYLADSRNDLFADRQLRGRAYQFAERHIATAVGRANLTLDEPGIFLFLGACCCQATGQQQGASYECLL